MPNLKKLSQSKDISSIILLKNVDEIDHISEAGLSQEQKEYIKSRDVKGFPVEFNLLERHIVVFVLPDEKTEHIRNEKVRIFGYQAFKYVKQKKVTEVQIMGNCAEKKFLAEGLQLSAYSFEKYKTKEKEDYDVDVFIDIAEEEISELNHVCEAVFFARTIVNEPQSFLSAPQLSEELKTIAKDGDINITVFEKKKIEELKMGGLLAVNLGSITPPTFNILEYKPSNAVNKKPLILVGKGVVYDTGGLSLKPTPNSMDMMKCDMGGSAVVAGAIYAVAKNKLPYHVITLIPATDNRPSGNAYAPGDVITMYNGSTVEVMNTDAEGRLILADTLTYAKDYEPELVIDVATLTGAAMRAIGKEGAVMMGTADNQEKSALKKAGDQVYERLVEFPLWDEYKESLQSDIADIKNLGGMNAGAITAGKFLETFTDYPWMHLDVAAPSFLSAEDKYRGKNGTGSGVRTIYTFIKNRLDEAR